MIDRNERTVANLEDGSSGESETGVRHRRSCVRMIPFRKAPNRIREREGRTCTPAGEAAILVYYGLAGPGSPGSDHTASSLTTRGSTVTGYKIPHYRCCDRPNSRVRTLTPVRTPSLILPPRTSTRSPFNSLLVVTALNLGHHLEREK